MVANAYVLSFICDSVQVNRVVSMTRCKLYGIFPARPSALLLMSAS